MHLVPTTPTVGSAITRRIAPNGNGMSAMRPYGADKLMPAVPLSSTTSSAGSITCTTSMRRRCPWVSPMGQSTDRLQRTSDTRFTKPKSAAMPEESVTESIAAATHWMTSGYNRVDRSRSLARARATSPLVHAASATRRSSPSTGAIARAASAEPTSSAGTNRKGRPPTGATDGRASVSGDAKRPAERSFELSSVLSKPMALVPLRMEEPCAPLPPIAMTHSRDGRCTLHGRRVEALEDIDDMGGIRERQGREESDRTEEGKNIRSAHVPASAYLDTESKLHVESGGGLDPRGRAATNRATRDAIRMPVGIVQRHASERWISRQAARCVRCAARVDPGLRKGDLGTIVLTHAVQTACPCLWDDVTLRSTATARS